MDDHRKQTNVNSYLKMLRYLKNSLLEQLFPAGWYYSRRQDVVLLGKEYKKGMGISEKAASKGSSFNGSVASGRYSQGITCAALFEEDLKYGNTDGSFVEDFASRILFTYRTAFEQIEIEEPPKDNPSAQQPSITSDAGWGCMIRVMQMLLAQSFLHAAYGRDWRHQGSCLSKSTENTPSEEKYLFSILRLFFDSYKSPLSVHWFVETANSVHKIPKGHRIGPTTSAIIAAQLLRSTVCQKALPVPLVALTFPDCQVEVGKVQQVWQDQPTGVETAVLILLPTRLGLDYFNEQEYKEIVRRSFNIPYFQGLAGGGPYTRAHYFVGSSRTHVFFLDPHIQVQSAATEETLYSSNFFTRVPRALSWELLNPSMAFGFLVSNPTELERLQKCLRAIDPLQKVFSDPREAPSEEDGNVKDFEICNGLVTSTLSIDDEGEWIFAG